MDLTPAERAQAVVRYLAKKNGITQAQVGLRLGYTNKSALSGVLTGSKRLPEKFGEKLAALDPAVNPDFLSGDSNDMLLPGYDQPAIQPSGAQQQAAPVGVVVPYDQLLKLLASLSEAVSSQQETIRSQQEMIRAAYGAAQAEKGSIG